MGLHRTSSKTSGSKKNRCAAAKLKVTLKGSLQICFNISERGRRNVLQHPSDNTIRQSKGNSELLFIYDNGFNDTETQLYFHRNLG